MMGYVLIVAIVILLGLYLLLRPVPNDKVVDMITLQQLSESARIEQPYASTPINKVDDYEFSRVFGIERNGRMEVPQQTFNLLLNKRTFDWPERPLSSDERRAKYMGLREGFTAAGDLKSYVIAQPDAPDIVKDALQQFRGEEKEVESMIQQMYTSDADYEPVVTKIGANHWEVNELRPRRKMEHMEQMEHVESVPAPTIKPMYTHNPIDPYFVATGDLPYESARHADPWYGPVPGMERMFGPTFDQEKWT